MLVNGFEVRVNLIDFPGVQNSGFQGSSWDCVRAKEHPSIDIHVNASVIAYDPDVVGFISTIDH